MTEPGQIITFYSYKGGVGRSMALANVACILAKKQGTKDARGVLVIDWDLEAPGLHRFFQSQISPSEQRTLDAKPGLIDLLAVLRKAVRGSETPKEEITPRLERALQSQLHLEDYIVKTRVESLSLLKAGRFDSKYSESVNTFQWARLYSSAPWIFSWLGNFLAEQYSFVLIDSRTGVTDASGICTAILPEKLVAVFTPNRQSLDGVLEQAAQATTYRKSSDDLRPLLVFPLPSRIEPSLERLRYYWRFDPSVGYQPRFEKLFEDIYALSKCELSSYFDDVQIQQVPDYAYGEEIATIQDLPTKDRFSLPRSYEAFTDRLVSGAAPWESPTLASKKVFISYSQQDSEFARRLKTDLANQGVSAWAAEEELQIGENLRKGISKAVQASDKVLVILSENSIRSPWVEFEIDAAVERERASSELVLLPIRLDGAVLETHQAWAAAIRRARHIGDFSHWKDPNSYQIAFGRLLRDLNLQPG